MSFLLPKDCHKHVSCDVDREKHEAGDKSSMEVHPQEHEGKEEVKVILFLILIGIKDDIPDRGSEEARKYAALQASE